MRAGGCIGIFLIVLEVISVSAQVETSAKASFMVLMNTTFGGGTDVIFYLLHCHPPAIENYLLQNDQRIQLEES
jgi:hypothetical protein